MPPAGIQYRCVIPACTWRESSTALRPFGDDNFVAHSGMKSK